jgi:oligopeptide transport system substrate-binding protein
LAVAQRIAKARELLRVAGLGHAPTLELRYNSNELHNRIAVAVAAMWKQALGIDTTLRAEEFKVLLQDIDRGDVSVFRASWLADYDDAYGFLQILQSGFGINLTHYASREFDELLERATSEADPARRRELLQGAEARMLADQPLIPLFFYVSKHLVDTAYSRLARQRAECGVQQKSRQSGPLRPANDRISPPFHGRVAISPSTL